MMKKECSAEEARFKAEAYCSASEHCKADVLGKLYQWGAPEECWEDVLKHLEQEKYIDESRYARAFVRDKYRFNQWGRSKIVQALRVKQIPASCISEALEEIEESEYLSALTSLLKKKLRSVKASNDYERNGKLIRFAAGHGYEMSDILLCLSKLGYDVEDPE